MSTTAFRLGSAFTIGAAVLAQAPAIPAQDPRPSTSPGSIEDRLRALEEQVRLADVEREALRQEIAKKAGSDKAAKWSDKIAAADRLLYRRGNFSGTMDQLICDALRGELNAEIALTPGFRWGTTALAGQGLTMEDVLAQTAVTYPETYVASMTGSQIKDVLEDVCDNLFNPDPYYQQGGDMVRVGGLSYACAPAETVGKRISELRLDGGRALEAGKSYKVAGWASVNEQKGTPVWEVVASHLRSGKPPNRDAPGVALKGVDDNPGIVGHP